MCGSTSHLDARGKYKTVQQIPRPKGGCSITCGWTIKYVHGYQYGSHNSVKSDLIRLYFSLTAAGTKMLLSLTKVKYAVQIVGWHS